MISEQEAIKIMRKYNAKAGTIQHGKGVSDIAFRLAVRIKERNPQFDIDPEKVKRAALLHDIGKCMPGKHELNSAEILRKEGLEEIAHLVIHGGLYEHSIIEGKEDKSLLPKTIENKIIDYADNRFNQNPVTVRERLDELRARRKDDKIVMKILDMIEPRVFENERYILELAGYRERDINKS